MPVALRNYEYEALNESISIYIQIMLVCVTEEWNGKRYSNENYFTLICYDMNAELSNVDYN